MRESTQEILSTVGQLMRQRIAATISLVRTDPTLLRAVLLVITSCTLTGCSFVGAPSFALFGAYFPAWMLCSLIGIIGAASTRMVLMTPAINDLIPLQLAVCTSVGIVMGVLAWMVLFR